MNSPNETDLVFVFSKLGETAGCTECTLSLPVSFCTGCSTPMFALGLGLLPLGHVARPASSCCTAGGLGVSGVVEQSTDLGSRIPDSSQVSPSCGCDRLQKHGGREVDSEISLINDTHHPTMTSLKDDLFGASSQERVSRHWCSPASRCLVVSSHPLMGKTNLLSTHGASDDHDVGGTEI